MIESWRGISPDIHPTAFVHPSAVVIGEVLLMPGASVWPGAVLRGDMGPIIVGENSNIQDNSVLHNTGGKSVTRIGARVTVGHRAILHGCIVEDDVLVGMGSILLDNCVVRAGSIVGAGALVSMKKEVPAGVLALGSPAKPARDLTRADRDWIDYSWRVYVDNARNYRSDVQ
jgi:carbonic anhydrase/acetyltransferase-like protein (isoleucine patch superfamily)